MKPSRRRAIACALLCAVVVFGCAHADNSDPCTAAGIIAFTRIQGTTYVLLADHVDSDRGWGTFGGHREAGETVPQTASREFREETRCVYPAPAAAELEGAPFVEQRTFLSYILEIDYVPAQVFDARGLPDDCLGEQYLERGPFAWVPLDDVIRTIASVDSVGVYTLPRGDVPATALTRKLWDESATILQKAIDAGYLN
jgi:8-oxo-dGTP pyrophosphatase MutT (NUDIX family)